MRSLSRVPLQYGADETDPALRSLICSDRVPNSLIFLSQQEKDDLYRRFGGPIAQHIYIIMMHDFDIIMRLLCVQTCMHVPLLFAPSISHMYSPEDATTTRHHYDFLQRTLPW